MDSFELNKIAGAVLASILVIMGIGVVNDAIFHKAPLEQNAYVVEGVEEEATADAGGAAVVERPDMGTLLAAATMEAGERAFKKCATCHNVEQGAANKTGPNLYGTMGHPIAGHAGFAYSDALKTHGGNWDFDTLDKYLENPKGYIPGNKMSFAGLKKPEERAAVLLFLNERSDVKLPLPAPKAPEAAAEPAPAPEGEAPAEAPAAAPAEDAQPQG